MDTDKIVLELTRGEARLLLRACGDFVNNDEREAFVYKVEVGSVAYKLFNVVAGWGQETDKCFQRPKFFQNINTFT
jgi:hypothetical protein